jgi:hypothetical protein
MFESLEDLKYHKDLADLIRWGVTKGQLPRYFFKYRPIDENLEKIIVGGQLRFSSPLEFNDPFDCKIFVDTNNSAKEIEQFIRRSSPELLSDKQVKQKARAWRNDPELLKEQMNRAAVELVASTGVCCFSVTPNNLLLWSHYSDEV